jgi:hypothetical protein
MVKPRVQWLTEDHSLWEIDWLRFLFKPVQDYIEVEFEKDKIKTDENTVLICNHSVPYIDEKLYKSHVIRAPQSVDIWAWL